MTFQYLNAPGRTPPHALGIDVDEAERMAIKAGERLLSAACWLMIAGAGLGLLAVTEKAIRNVIHTLSSCGAC